MNVNRVQINCLIFFMSLGLVYLSTAFADQLSLPSADLVAPEVNHEGYTKAVVAGTHVQLKATVTDNVGVKTVTLYYRVKGGGEYNRTSMTRIGNSDEYFATIPSEKVVEPGIEYYIQAVDLAGNALLHGYSFSPLIVGVSQTPSLIVTQKGVPAGTDVASQSSQSDNNLLKNKWLWIGVGVIAAGIVYSQNQGDDDGGVVTKPTSVVVTAPTP